MSGMHFVRWTAWLAVAAYFARWLCPWTPVSLLRYGLRGINLLREHPRPVSLILELEPAVVREQASRWCWTLGCGILWFHVFVAFQFVHHWSHAAAVNQVRLQSRHFAGIDWGGGVWFNYATLAFWLIDVLWWWGAPGSFTLRPRWMNAVWQGWLAFMGFNAAVVFAEGFIRWSTLAALVLLAALHRYVPRPSA